MNAVMARRVNGTKNTSKPKRGKVCVHQRMVSSQYNEKGQVTGNVICRECGAVIPSSQKIFS